MEKQKFETLKTRNRMGLTIHPVVFFTSSGMIIITVILSLFFLDNIPSSILMASRCVQIDSREADPEPNGLDASNQFGYVHARQSRGPGPVVPPAGRVNLQREGAYGQYRALAA